MRFVTVRNLRGKSGQIWKKLAKMKEMVITSNGKPIAILSPTTEEMLEESLAAIRQARAIHAVQTMQLKSVQKGLDRLSLEDINAEVRAARKSRAKCGRQAS